MAFFKNNTMTSHNEQMELMQLRRLIRKELHEAKQQEEALQYFKDNQDIVGINICKNALHQVYYSIEMLQNQMNKYAVNGKIKICGVGEYELIKRIK